jgi:hypothetical protein
MITKTTKTIVTFKDNGKELSTINKIINRLIKVFTPDEIHVYGENNCYGINFIQQNTFKTKLILDINVIDNKITDYNMDKREFSVKDRARIKRIIKDYVWIF